MVENLPAMWETQVWPLSWGSSPGKGNGNPLQYSCLENPTDRGAWQATVRGVTKLDRTEQLHVLSFGENPQGNTIPLEPFFFFLIEGPFLLSSHESVPASWRRYILIGKSRPYEGLITWVRLHSLASHQISSLNPQISMTGYFLGLRSGRVGKSEGGNCLRLLASGSSVSLGLPDNGFPSRIPLWEVPAFLILYVFNLIGLEGL